MLTLELGRVELGLLFGGLGLTCVAFGLVAWLLWRQHRQIQRSLTGVCGQVAAFAEASMSVAQTVEQSLVMPQQARGHAGEAGGSTSRREVLQVGARRLTQKQPPSAVQQALGLKDDELRLLCLGVEGAQAALDASQNPQHDTLLDQASAANRAKDRGVPRAVA